MKNAIRFILVLTALWAAHQATAAAFPTEDPCLNSHKLGLTDSLRRKFEAVCFTTSEVGGYEMISPAPTARLRKSLRALIAENPGANKLRPALAWYETRMENFNAAEREMMAHARYSRDRGAAYIALADFYHAFLKYGREVAALEKAAKAQRPGDAARTYRRLISLIENCLLKSRDKFVYYRKITALRPKSTDAYRDLIDALVADGKKTEAMAELDRFHSKFPSQVAYYVREKAELLLSRKKEREAIELYRRFADPVRHADVTQEYFGLLLRLKKLPGFRRALVEKEKSGSLDWTEFKLLFQFYLYRDDYEKARELLRRAAAGEFKAAGRSRVTELGALAERVQENETALKCYYTAYLRAGRAGREKLLLDIYRVLNTGGRNRLAGAPAVLGEFLNLRHADANPSILGGALSLALNDQALPQWTSDLNSLSAEYFNRKAAHLVFRRFTRDYPKSGRVSDMYAGEMTSLMDYGRYDHAYRLAAEYSKRFPKGRGYYEINTLAAQGYAKQSRWADEAEVYSRLMRKAAADRKNTEYFRALESLARSLVKRNKHVEVIALYRAEIDRRPNDEKLYEILLDFVSEHNLLDEERKVYEAAARRFKTKNWRHRLARWYLRNELQNEFVQTTRELVKVMNGGEMEDYFDETMNESLDFSKEMYRYALGRFPYNVDFVIRLLNYYEHEKFEFVYMHDESMALYAKYYALDAEVRARAGRYSWVEGGSFVKVLKSAEAAVSGGSPPPVALQLVADDLVTRSRFENALEIFNEELLPLYPGDRELLLSTAELYRSLDTSFYVADADYTRRAAELYAKTSRLWPRNREYYILAGEVWAEAGKFERAVSYWDAITQIEKGSADAWLEAATVYWDYYQFDKCVDTFMRGRKTLGDPALHSVKLAAAYESDGRYDEAFAEYFRAVKTEQIDRSRVVTRLAYLANNKNMGKRIDAAFDKWMTPRGDWRVALTRADYLEWMGRSDELLEFLRGVYSRYKSIDFLETAYYFFDTKGDFDYRVKTVRRMAELNDWQPYYYRRLVGMYEEKSDLAAASKVYSEVLEKYRALEPNEGDLFGAMLESADFEWRRGKRKDALAVYDEALKIAPEWRRESLRLDVVDKLIAARGFDKAVEILDEMISESPANSSCFERLVGVHAKRKDGKGLADALARSLDLVKKKGYAPDTEKAVVRELRLAAAGGLAKLKMFTEAQDQYIEALNAEPLDESLTLKAYRFSKAHKLSKRIRAFYEKTAKESSKNYRWFVLLALFDREDGRWEPAAKNLRVAVRIEPSRVELYQLLADAALRAWDYELAAEAYRGLLEYEGNSRRKLDIARMMFRTGKESSGLQMAHGLSKGAAGHGKYFEAARFLSEMGRPDDALGMFKKGFEVFRGNPYGKSLTTEEVGAAATTFVVANRLNDYYSETDKTMELLSAETSKAVNFKRNVIEESRNAIGGVERNSLPGLISAYGRSADYAAFAERILAAAGRDNDYWRSFDTAVSAARKIGDTILEEKILLKKVQVYRQAFLRNDNLFNSYLGVVGETILFYRSRMNLRAAADFADERMEAADGYEAAELARIAAGAYRSLGDTDIELDRLDAYFTYYENSNENVFKSSFETRYLETERYFDVLRSLKRGDRLDEIALHRGAFTGTFVNHMAHSGDAARADAAIDNACAVMPPVWRKTKKMLAHQIAGDGSPSANVVFKDALFIAPIGRQLGVTIDRDAKLAGALWFDFTALYADWLIGAGRPKAASNYIPAPVEDDPLSADAFAEAGDMYLDAGMVGEAIAYYENAAMKKASNENFDRLARAYVKKKDKKSALRALRRIIAAKDADPWDYHFFAEAMERRGFASSAARELEKASARFAAMDRFPDGFSECLGWLSAHHGAGGRKWFDYLKSLRVRENNKSDFFDLVVERELVSPARREHFYLAAADGEKVGSWQWLDRMEALVNYYLSRKGSEEKGLQALERVFEEAARDASEGGDVYWAEKARVKFEARLGSKNAARHAKSFIRKQDYDRSEYAGMLGAFVDAKQPAAADDLSLWFYSAIGESEMTAADHAALARILHKRKRNKDAARTAERLARISPDDADNTALAADLFYDFGDFARSEEFYRRAALIAPANRAHRLGEAKAMWRAGRSDEALKRLRAMVVDERAPRETALDAARFLADNLKPGRARACAKWMARRIGRGNHANEVKYYAVYRLGGDADWLKRGIEELYKPAMLHAEYGRYLMERGNRDGALSQFVAAFRSGGGGDREAIAIARILDAKKKYRHLYEIAEAYNLLDKLRGAKKRSASERAEISEIAASACEKSGEYAAANNWWRFRAELAGKNEKLKRKFLKLADAARRKADGKSRKERDVDTRRILMALDNGGRWPR